MILREQFQMSPQHHVSLLHGTLKCLGLNEELHKASLPARVMISLDLQFNMINITMSIIPQDKLKTTLLLV